ncbi:MAG: ferredoxin:protochlorophyllide reductase (ATP-dependent) subunit B [Gemmatimonadaceae bacterium]|nr:ferredoxin:protochlorophyllide reductase (ATP-dependent) subunit B [Gemmatimonadaceae bacterium]
MQLTLWTYEGPPHVGAGSKATTMKGVHYVLHAPQGDTYADLLFTMIERQDARPPVTYTTFQARDLGGDTANLVKVAVQDAYDRFKPQALLVGESCTAELIQDQPGSLAQGMGIPVPIVPLELPAYSKKENWGAAETLYHLTKTLLADRIPKPGTARPPREPGVRPKANLLGPTVLGFRCRDDVREITQLLAQLGIDVNVIAPLGASPDDIRRIPDADVNVDLYPEVSRTTVSWLQRNFGIPYTKTIPMGTGATRDFVAEVASLVGIDPSPVLGREQPGVAALSASQARAPWYARSVDSTYLTGKRVFIFADATHAIAAARIAAQEMGFTVVGLGTYSREFAREVREAAKLYGVEALITDDYLEVEAAIAAATPELVLGTQMERHIAKRLGVACAVISVPIHVQDVPARYSPVYGFEGANVLFDTWVHPLVMGLEEHLLQMFREDFEFHDDAVPSHLATSAGGAPAAAPVSAGAPAAASVPLPAPAPDVAARAPQLQHTMATPAFKMPVPAAAAAAPAPPSAPVWTPDGEKELKKIPFFVRGKAKRNTERYAEEHGITQIGVDTLYEAKAHFGK